MLLTGVSQAGHGLCKMTHVFAQDVFYCLDDQFFPGGKVVQQGSPGCPGAAAHFLGGGSGVAVFRQGLQRCLQKTPSRGPCAFLHFDGFSRVSGRYDLSS